MGTSVLSDVCPCEATRPLSLNSSMCLRKPRCLWEGSRAPAADLWRKHGPCKTRWQSPGCWTGCLPEQNPAWRGWNLDHTPPSTSRRSTGPMWPHPHCVRWCRLQENGRTSQKLISTCEIKTTPSLIKAFTRIVKFTLCRSLLPLSEGAGDDGVRNLSPVTA